MDKKQMDFMKTLQWTMNVAEVGPGETPRYTVRELMEQFGGIQGEITDPLGNKHQLSLVEWADRPDTGLKIGFRSSKFKADSEGNPIA